MMWVRKWWCVGVGTNTRQGVFLHLDNRGWYEITRVAMQWCELVSNGVLILVRTQDKGCAVWQDVCMIGCAYDMMCVCSTSTASPMIACTVSSSNCRSNWAYVKQAKSQCNPSSREINSFEKAKPGIKPRFLSQKMAQNEPLKKMPSTAAKATIRCAKDRWAKEEGVGEGADVGGDGDNDVCADDCDGGTMWLLLLLLLLLWLLLLWSSLIHRNAQSALALTAGTSVCAWNNVCLTAGSRMRVSISNEYISWWTASIAIWKP